MGRVSRSLRMVVSASRRTDLVAHYPDYMAERLHQIGPSRIHSVVVWTKDPVNLLQHQDLRQALDQVGQVFIHWTVTGLGGSFLEPLIPTWQQQVALLPAIVAFAGDPRRIHWRYDPLVTAQRGHARVENTDPALFSLLAHSFAAVGVDTVHVSFATIYAKVARRLAETGVSFQDYSTAARRKLLSTFAELAASRGMLFHTCCEPGFPRQRCIDGELLTMLHPTREPCRAERAAGQRELCGCTVSLDLGRYLPCPGQCLYCYAHPKR
jgi:hypothetical protein